MNLAEFGSHELRLSEVLNFRQSKKFWGWVDGMFVAGNDDMIATRFLHGASYESVTREIWKRCCKGAKLVVDVGTHSGVFSLDAFRAGAEQVMSIEPNPINYSRLILNLRYNNFSVEGAFYGALGDIDRVGMLLVKNGLWSVHAAGRMDLKNKNGMEVPVRARRLDSLLAKERWADLKVLKIDAENYTPNVLSGMKGIFDEGHRPDLIIECTAEGMGEILKKLGYRFWRIWETGNVEEVEDLVPHNPDNNYNGTDEDCRNRFASVQGLPNG